MGKSVTRKKIIIISIHRIPKLVLRQNDKFLDLLIQLLTFLCSLYFLPEKKHVNFVGNCTSRRYRFSAMYFPISPLKITGIIAFLNSLALFISAKIRGKKFIHFLFCGSFCQYISAKENFYLNLVASAVFDVKRWNN